jgi:hypothetical protein
MKRALLAVFLTLASLAAQTDKDPEKRQEQDQGNTARKRVQRIFVLKYADPGNMFDLLRVFDANIGINSELHALSVTAPEQTMQALELAINKLDVPAAAVKNIELTMQLVIGSDGDAGGGALPKDLEPVVTQLRNAFPFKSYRLLDVLTMRTRSGRPVGTTSSGGSMQFGGSSKPVVSTFNINSSRLGEDGTTVRLDGVRASSRIPVEMGQGSFSFQELNLNTDVDIKAGQKVVIGRHGINREQALFLVVSAQVVN